MTIYTPYFNPERCLEEAKQCKVRVRGSWFPASIFGRCKALCAFIRMWLCALYVVLFAGAMQCYILDQVSFPIPLLRCRNRRVIYYCHFPDKLLSTNRTGRVMRCYRYFLDYAEELTTGMASDILVNSNFTRSIFEKSFPILRRRHPNLRPQILYPAIIEKNYILP